MESRRKAEEEEAAAAAAAAANSKVAREVKVHQGARPIVQQALQEEDLLLVEVEEGEEGDHQRKGAPRGVQHQLLPEGRGRRPSRRTKTRRTGEAEEKGASSIARNLRRGAQVLLPCNPGRQPLSGK